MSTILRARPLPPAHVSASPSAGVELRPLEPGDSAAVLAVFAGMGPRSRELRFLTAKSQLTGAEVRRLTAVDQRDHVAFLASAAPGRRPIGIARFIRAGDRAESADVAVAVVDSWQNRGVGTMLLGALVRRAAEVGVRRFTMLVSQENVAVLRLVHRLPGALSLMDVGHGVVEYSLSLDGGLP